MDWLISSYILMFEETTGSRANSIERNFINNFFNSEFESLGKIIYYEAVFEFKRGLPQLIIYYKIKFRVLYNFKKQDAPKSLVAIHSQFAKKIFEFAKRKYCK
jgi:hypothetical protein